MGSVLTTPPPEPRTDSDTHSARLRSTLLASAREPPDGAGDDADRPASRAWSPGGGNAAAAEDSAGSMALICGSSTGQDLMSAT